MRKEVNSTKSKSIYIVDGEEKRAMLHVTGEASVNKNVMKEVGRIRIHGASFDEAMFVARQLSKTY